MNAFPVLPSPPLGYPGRTPDPSIVNLGRMAGYRLGFYPTHYGLGWGGFPGVPCGGWVRCGVLGRCGALMDEA